MDIPQVFIIYIMFSVYLFLDFTHDAAPLPRKEPINELSTGASYPLIDPTKVITLGWHPRAFIYKGFLTDEECDHIISLADSLQRARVTDVTGERVESDVRTSYSMFIKKAQDKVVADIEARIAAWTMIPEENGEPMDILRYQHTQRYGPHYDYFFDKHNQEYGGQRFATVLMYLSNVEKGGETAFPESEDTTPKDDDSWSDCGKQGKAVKPNKGDALLFFNIKPNATLDKYSLHSGCPVIAGEKWSLTKWIHVASFETEYPLDTYCRDTEDECALWASEGECEKNPAYMIGSNTTRGECRLSCKACSP